MQLSSVLTTYAHFFYLIGQSVYNPVVETWKSWPLLHYTYIGVYFATVTILTVVGETLELHALTTHDEKATPMLAIGIAITACSNFAAIIQCTLHPDSLEEIHQLFFQVDHVFRRNLRRTISYQPYRNTYRMKFIICVLLTAINAFVVVILNILTDREVHITTINIILASISALKNLHAVFYVGLHVFIQEQFCRIIDSVCGVPNVRSDQKTDVLFVQSRNSREIITKIQIYKIVHFKLWKASQLISEYFGWEIVVFYLLSFLDMTNSVFYIYIFAQSGHFAAGIMRTYRFFYFQFDNVRLRNIYSCSHCNRLNHLHTIDQPPPSTVN